MAVIFDFRHTRMSNSLLKSLSVLPDPENMGIAIGISLLSCTRVEIHVISCLLSVYGRHLWFPTYTDVGPSSHYSLRVARPRKHGCNRWKFVAILYTSWDTRNFLSAFGLWPPSLISDIPGRRTVFPSVFPCCPTTKTWVHVGISLLTCIRAEIYVISCLFPVYGRHLWFPTYPDVKQSSQKPLRVARSWKHGYSHWNFFAILYTSWDTRYFLSAFGLWPPSLISDIHRRRTVFPLLTPCCPSSKTWV